MSPRFFQTSVTLSPLLVALASLVSLELPATSGAEATNLAVWQGCQQRQSAGQAPADQDARRGGRTQWPAWRRDAEAAVERCLRDELSPAATARRVRPAGAAV